LFSQKIKEQTIMYKNKIHIIISLVLFSLSQISLFAQDITNKSGKHWSISGDIK